MDRTLFSPSMIDTFRACQRAYELAFTSHRSGEGKRNVPSICRQFVRKGIAEINRGKITSDHEVQTFMGKHWPLEEMEASGADPDMVAHAFLFSYKALLTYSRNPYRPKGAEVAAVALKARSRLSRVRVYLEDTFDLILFYPDRKHLEIVEYELRSKRAFSSAWPTVSALVKRFLCERLRIRWPFETVSLTTVKINASKTMFSINANNTEIEESIYRLHFDDVIRDLEKMKCPQEKVQAREHEESCQYCQTLSRRYVKESPGGEEFLSLRSA